MPILHFDDAAISLNCQAITAGKVSRLTTKREAHAAQAFQPSGCGGCGVAGYVSMSNAGEAAAMHRLHVPDVKTLYSPHVAQGPAGKMELPVIRNWLAFNERGPIRAVRLWAFVAVIAILLAGSALLVVLSTIIRAAGNSPAL